MRHYSIDNHISPLFQVFRPPYLGIDPHSRCCRDAFDIIDKDFEMGIEVNAAELRRYDEKILKEREQKERSSFAQPF